jgi:hypothetical protein
MIVRDSYVQQASFASSAASATNSILGMTMTENRRKRRKVIAQEGRQQGARHQKKPVNRDVSISTMNETEIMEALIDEHEAAEAAHKGKK